MQAKLWNLNSLAVELGRDRRALARALEDLKPDEESIGPGGRTARKYKMARVFEHLSSGGESGDYDGHKQRTRKDKELADKLALENELTRGETMKTEEALQTYVGFAVACRSRLTQVADAIAQFVDPRYAPIVVDEVRRRINEALAEIAAGIPEGDDATADADGERVGGLEPEAVERGERRARAVAN